MDNNKNNLNALFNRIKTEIVSGAKHGFFDYEISGEKINGKAHITFKAGKSHKFIITNNELYPTSVTEGAD